MTKRRTKRTINHIAAIILAILSIMMLVGCNRQPVDLTYSYDRAIIKLPNGEIIDGKCSSWRDYEDGDQIQIVIDGTTYLTHISNAVLIK